MKCSSSYKKNPDIMKKQGTAILEIGNKILMLGMCIWIIKQAARNLIIYIESIV